MTETLRLLPAPSFDNVPVTVIVWTDGGTSERHGHLTPADIAARYGTREALSVTYTDTATCMATPGTLAVPVPRVALYGIPAYPFVARIEARVQAELGADYTSYVGRETLDTATMARAEAMMREGRG